MDGTTVNLSVRLGEGILNTPTGSSFGFVKHEKMAQVYVNNCLVIGVSKPSKEFPFHLAAYRAWSDIQAVVHLHSTPSVAMSCLEELDPINLRPQITPYLVMKVGALPLIPY